MWTEAATHTHLIYDTVSDRKAQILLFQARVNLELFNYTRVALGQALDLLNQHDFARVMSCHIIEGIFGADRHYAEQLTQRERVVGFLLATVTAGHRFTKALRLAGAKDRGGDWKELRVDIRLLEKQYHWARNFLEHMHDAVGSGQLSGLADGSFTPAGLLTFKYEGQTSTFDFSADALEHPQKTYDKLVAMLTARESRAEGSPPLNPST
jgi:hypothetical protein